MGINKADVESKLLALLASQQKISPLSKAVILGRFATSPVSVSAIAKKFNVSRQNVDQIEKRIIGSGIKLLGEDVINEFISELPETFKANECLKNQLASFFLTKIFTRCTPIICSSDWICSQKNQEKKTDSKIVSQIITVLKQYGLPIDLSKVLSQETLDEINIALKDPANILRRFVIKENILFYMGGGAKFGFIGNFSAYLQKGDYNKGGIQNILSAIYSNASSSLAEEGLNSIDDMINTISSRAFNIKVKGRLVSLGGGKWETAEAFEEMLGGVESSEKIIQYCLGLSQSVPCEITSSYLLEKMNDSSLSSYARKLNPYSLKSLLVNSGLFENIKKFGIIEKGKDCGDKKDMSMKKNIKQLLSDGKPRTSREIEADLKKLGLAHVWQNITLVLSDKKTFDKKETKYFLVKSKGK